jgi:nitrite reductase (NO-forming)
MHSRRFAPTPLTLAALVAAALAAPVTLAADPVHAPQAAVKPAGVSVITLSTGIVDGKMVFLDDKGKPNPTLKAKVGDTIEIRISSGEGAQHDIVFPALNVHSAHFDKSTGPTKVRFKVTKAGTFEYYCTIAGHRQIGMEGVLEVSGPATAAAGAGTAPRRRHRARCEMSLAVRRGT